MPRSLYYLLDHQILYLDSSEVCFPTVPGTENLDSQSTQIGSSVDAPPRPCHTTPDSYFGNEVSVLGKGLRPI